MLALGAVHCDVRERLDQPLQACSIVTGSWLPPGTAAPNFPQVSPTPAEGGLVLPQGPEHRTLQGPLNGVVEVQGGLSGEASSEVNVADARDPDRMAATAVDLAQAQAHVTRVSDPSPPAPGGRWLT